MRKPQASASSPQPLSGYAEFLAELKGRIRSAQIKAALSVNRELILLYWDIGHQIVEQQEKEGWGGAVIERLANDLQKDFPGIKGFSPRNIWHMRAFYLTYPGEVKKLPQAVAEIPWGHNVLLFEKIKDSAERLWYAQKTVEHGWSRAVLWHQIDTKLYDRQAKKLKTTNFPKTLPPTQSDLALEIIKDPYNFDFLTLADDAREKELEKGLLLHLREFLIELGKGFSFVGSQYHLEIGNEDFYIDLLFYHLRLRCFIVIDLKRTEFKPEYAGKMNFYLSAVDDLLRQPGDHPSIGIILCKTKKHVIVEYALRDARKPIGVSEFRVTAALPEPLKGSLPTIEELESELAGENPSK